MGPYDDPFHPNVGQGPQGPHMCRNFLCWSERQPWHRNFQGHAGGKGAECCNPPMRRKMEKMSVTLRVQVPNNQILTQNLYYNYYYPKPKYLIVGYMDPLGQLAQRSRVAGCEDKLSSTWQFPKTGRPQYRGFPKLGVPF